MAGKYLNTCSNGMPKRISPGRVNLASSTHRANPRVLYTKKQHSPVRLRQMAEMPEMFAGASRHGIREAPCTTLRVMQQRDAFDFNKTGPGVPRVALKLKIESAGVNLHLAANTGITLQRFECAAFKRLGHDSVGTRRVNRDEVPVNLD